MGTRVSDVISKLPPELQDIATRLFKSLLEQGVSELEKYLNHQIDMLLTGDWRTAYSAMVRRMDTVDIQKEFNRVNAKLEAMASADAMAYQVQKEMLREVLTVGMSILLAAV